MDEVLKVEEYDLTEHLNYDSWDSVSQQRLEILQDTRKKIKKELSKHAPIDK